MCLIECVVLQDTSRGAPMGVAKKDRGPEWSTGNGPRSNGTAITARLLLNWLATREPHTSIHITSIMGALSEMWGCVVFKQIQIENPVKNTIQERNYKQTPKKSNLRTCDRNLFIRELQKHSFKIQMRQNVTASPYDKPHTVHHCVLISDEITAEACTGLWELMAEAPGRNMPFLGPNLTGIEVWLW